MGRILLRNISSLLGYRVIDTLLYLALIIVLSRSLGVAAVGRYTFALAVPGLVFLLSGLGISQLVACEIATSSSDARASVGALLPLYALTGAMAFAVAALAAFLLGPGTLHLVLIASLSFLIGHLSQVFAMGFWGREEMHYIAAGGLVSTLITVPLAFHSIMSGRGLTGVFLALLLGSAGQAAFSWLLFVRRFGAPLLRLDSALWKRVALGSLPFLVKDVLLLALLRLDMIMVGSMLDSLTAGLFGAAFTVLKNLLISAGLLGDTLYPRLSRLWKENRPGFFSLLSPATLLAFAASALFSLCLTLAARQFLTLVFGKAFADAVPYLRVLLAAGLFLVPLMVLISALNAAHRPWEAAALAIIAFMLNLFLGLLLIPRWGALGAAYATALSAAVTAAVSLVPLARLRKEAHE